MASAFLHLQEAKRLHADAIEIYRCKHNLLSADELRSIRERYGLTPGLWALARGVAVLALEKQIPLDAAPRR